MSNNLKKEFEKETGKLAKRNREDGGFSPYEWYSPNYVEWLEKKSSQVNTVVSKKQDSDILFFYEKAGKSKIMTMDEASMSHTELINKGYNHIATIKASTWIEALLNNSSHRLKKELIKELSS
jgi:hypothetical protein